MKRAAATAASLVFALAAAAGCSSSKSSTSGSSTTAAAGATTTSSVAATSTTKAASTGGDSAAFCKMLAADTEKVAGFQASIGTPAQAAKVAEIKADNAAVLAAAPADLHDAVAKVYAVSELGLKALDPTLSAADKSAARAEVLAAVSAPATKAAIASYKAWVTAHCGALAPKILSGGL